MAPAARIKLDIGTVHFPTSLTHAHELGTVSVSQKLGKIDLYTYKSSYKTETCRTISQSIKNCQT